MSGDMVLQAVGLSAVCPLVCGAGPEARLGSWREGPMPAHWWAGLGLVPLVGRAGARGLPLEVAVVSGSL